MTGGERSMPSWGYWFSGAAVKALGTVIFSVMALVGTGYNWYRAAISEEHAAEEKEQGRMANATRLITMIDTLSALDRQLDVVSKFPGEFGDIYVVHWLNALSG